jgi:hypothetical protein
MQGKKLDSEFISSFIEESIKLNNATIDGIVNAAQKEIYEIDEKIREIEQLKTRRCKLNNVIEYLKKPKADLKQMKILKLYEIKNHNICKEICNSLPLKIKQIKDKNIIYAIKQLVDYKIIVKVGDIFIAGEMFEEYKEIK